MNIYLKEYNITLLDKNKITFEIVSVLYGIDDFKIDITKKIVTNYYNGHNKTLIIPVNTDINKLYYDPVPNVLKYIYVIYKINNIEINDIFIENSYVNINSEVHRILYLMKNITILLIILLKQ